MTQPTAVHVVIPQNEYSVIAGLLSQALIEQRAAREEMAEERRAMLKQLRRLRRHVVSLWIALGLLALAGAAGWLLGLTQVQ
jgi:transcriptional regulator of NAD metabolism